MKTALFGKSRRVKYSRLLVEKDKIKQTIFQHPEFTGYIQEMDAVFAQWKQTSAKTLKNLQVGLKPKEVIFELSEKLLKQYSGKDLINRYDVYQHLMNYWTETMQDDCYIIAADGWKAETCRILVENKQKKMVDKGWTCDLVPKSLVVDRFFLAEKQAIEKLEAEKENIAAQLTELEEEHSGEDGFFAEMDRVNKGAVQSRLKEIKDEADSQDKRKLLKAYLELLTRQADTNKIIKEATAELDKKLYDRYPALKEDEIKTLVVDDKWIATIEKAIQTEMDRISQRLTQRIKELAERYETPLPAQTDEVKELESKVNAHLEKMGFVWK